jgi:RimJ/RimL family protein N-acetyltransferase
MTRIPPAADEAPAGRGLRETDRMNVLKTERLALRHILPDDGDFLLVLLNDPSFLRNIGDRGVRTMEEARTYIMNGPVASYERHGFGLYMVALRESGERLGICGLVKRDALEDVDIGFAFLPVYWAKGYAIESATAVRDYARDRVGLTRLVAVVQPENQPSIRVLEKLGLRPERTVRLDPKGPDLVLYAIKL